MQTAFDEVRMCVRVTVVNEEEEERRTWLQFPTHTHTHTYLFNRYHYRGINYLQAAASGLGFKLKQWSHPFFSRYSFVSLFFTSFPVPD